MARTLFARVGEDKVCDLWWRGSAGGCSTWRACFREGDRSRAGCARTGKADSRAGCKACPASRFVTGERGQSPKETCPVARGHERGTQHLALEIERLSLLWHNSRPCTNFVTQPANCIARASRLNRSSKSSARRSTSIRSAP